MIRCTPISGQRVHPDATVASVTPEDDDDFIPEMPDDYGAEHLEGERRDIAEMSDDELAAHDIEVS